LLVCDRRSDVERLLVSVQKSELIIISPNRWQSRDQERLQFISQLVTTKRSATSDVVVHFKPTASVHLTPKPVSIIAIEGQLVATTLSLAGKETSPFLTFPPNPRSDIPTLLTLHR
jgi:hypothetical protein